MTLDLTKEERADLRTALEQLVVVQDGRLIDARRRGAASGISTPIMRDAERSLARRRALLERL